MDTQKYIKVGSLYWMIQPIPESASGDTVTVEIRRLSDGYTWNFDTTAFTETATTGTMTFVNGIIWKTSFTPPTEDTYIVTVEDSTLDIKHTQVLQAVGAVAQAGATGNELTTLANVREFLEFPDDQTDDDTLLEKLITRMSADIESDCDRIFGDATYTEYHDGDGTDTLLLKQYPINSITSVHDDVDRDYDTDTLIDSDDYVYDSETGILTLDGFGFSIGRQNVKVVYNAGYTTIPTDLEQACINKVVIKYLQGKAGMSAFDSDHIERISNMEKYIEKVIRKYRKPA